MQMNNIQEIRRLSFGLSDNESSELFKTEIIARCSGNSSEVLEKTKEVLKIVINCELSFDDPVDDWEAVLPKWFVDACSPEISKEEAEELIKTGQGFETLSNMWTVSGFIYWFRPDQRSWYWWDGVTKDLNTLKIYLLVNGFPFAWGALEFLLKAAGVNSVEQV